MPIPSGLDLLPYSYAGIMYSGENARRRTRGSLMQRCTKSHAAKDAQRVFLFIGSSETWKIQQYVVQRYKLDKITRKRKTIMNTKTGQPVLVSGGQSTGSGRGAPRLLPRTTGNSS